MTHFLSPVQMLLQSVTSSELGGAADEKNEIRYFSIVKTHRGEWQI
jgi:hypothetical protein